MSEFISHWLSSRLVSVEQYVGQCEKKNLLALPDCCCVCKVIDNKYRLIHRNCPQRRTPSQNGGSASRIHQHTAKKRGSASRIYQPKGGSASRFHQPKGGSASRLYQPDGGPPLEFINIQPPKVGPPLEFINLKTQKGGPPLEFINLQPQNEGPPLESINHQPKNRGPPLGTISMDLAVHTMYSLCSDTKNEAVLYYSLAIYKHKQPNICKVNFSKPLPILFVALGIYNFEWIVRKGICSL